MERYIIMKIAKRRKMILLIILVNFAFYLIGFSTWTYYNQKTHHQFINNILKENISKTTLYIINDSLNISHFGSIDFSTKHRIGWREETGDYIANIKYTPKYPNPEVTIDKIRLVETNYLLYKKWFFSHILHRYMTDSLNIKYSIYPNNIAIKLEHSPTYLTAPTTKITFTYPEKKDSILQSMCYTDSFPVSFNYQNAPIISDTIEIGYQGEGRLIAYSNMSPFTIVDTGMRSILYNLSIASVVLFTVSCVIIYMLFFMKEKIIETVIEKEVEKVLYVEKIRDLPTNQEPIYEYEKLIVKPKSKLIEYEGRTIKCRKMIVDLLMILLNNPDHIIVKEEFEEHFWKDQKLDVEYLNRNIHNLIYETKKVLKGMPFEIIPLRGNGYKLEKADPNRKVVASNKKKSDSPPPKET